MNRRRTVYMVLGLAVLGLAAMVSGDAPAAPVLPRITIGASQASSPQDVAVTLQILFLLTILTLAPAILLLMTPFTRIVIVLSFLRQALGTQQIPPNQVLIGLALFMTFFVMRPTGDAVYKDALKPYMDGRISYTQALDRAQLPVRKFMFAQTREKDLALFVKLS